MRGWCCQNSQVFLGVKKGGLGFVGFCGKGAWLNKDPGESRLLAAGLWPGSKPTHPTRRDPQGSTYHETERGLRLKIVVLKKAELWSLKKG